MRRASAVLFLFAVALPVAAAPTQDPAALPGLRLWLRADAGVQLTGGGVSQWSDQSGAGNHVTQATAALRPTLAPNVVNGLPAVRFGGTHQLDGALGGTWTAGTVVVLLQFTVTSSNNDYVYAIGVPGSSGSQITLSRTNGDDAYHYDGATPHAPSWTTLPPNQFLVLSQTYGETDAASQLLRDGGHWILPSRAANAYAVNGASFVLGNWSGGSYRLSSPTPTGRRGAAAMPCTSR